MIAAETLVILALAAIGAYELVCVINDVIARIIFNHEQARQRAKELARAKFDLRRQQVQIFLTNRNWDFLNSAESSESEASIDPSTFTCALCKYPYDIVGETSLHTIWRCFCGVSEYRQRKRGKR
ncbi:MAG: hypothetical protein WCD86_16980 [Ktedonobacteraceae bacterium]